MLWDFVRIAAAGLMRGDVCGCCGGAGSYGYESDDDEPDLSRGNQSRSKIYSKKAWDLYMDFNDSEALRYIDMALDLDNRSSGCWNIRAIILEGMKRYMTGHLSCLLIRRYQIIR